MNVLSLCKKREDGVFEVDPAVMFPAIVERIKAVRAGELPDELGESGAAFMKKYTGVKDEALNLALKPLDVFLPFGEEEVSLTAMKSMSRALRADALAFAEDYFQRALCKQVGKGLRIHITRNEDYRR